MNKFAFYLSLSALVCYAGVASAASTCSSLAASTISAPNTVAGNTCGNNTTTISAVCTGLTTLNGAGADVYGLTIGASYSNVQVSVTPTGFDPGLFVMAPTPATACGNQACEINQQAVSATAVSGTMPTGLAAGTYFIVVADSGSDAPGCGAYNLQVSGTLPVKLQKFSVK